MGPKITAVSDCSHEIKWHLLLGRKAMTNLDSVLENRDITLLTKVHIVKAMDFPVVMYGYESWTMKKHWRIAWKALKNWYFWILVLEKALESPLDSKKIKPINSKGNQFDILWKDWCWSSNILATWSWLEKILMLGKIEGRIRNERKNKELTAILGFSCWLNI